MFSFPDIAVGCLATLGVMYIFEKVKRRSVVDDNAVKSKQEERKIEYRAQPLTEEEMAQAGRYGEEKVIKCLAPFEQDYGVYHDVKFKSEEGEKRQLDHVVVTDNAIFVIETKTYSSKQKIIQTENGSWVKKKEGRVIRNPYIQLKVAISILDQILRNENLSGFTIQPVVAFAYDVTTVNIESNIPHMNVEAIPHYIKNYYCCSGLPGHVKDRLNSVMSMIQSGEAYSWDNES